MEDDTTVGVRKSRSKCCSPALVLGKLLLGWGASCLSVTREKVSPEDWEEPVSCHTGRYTLSHLGSMSSTSCEFIFWSLALPLILTRSISLIFEPLPKPRRGKALILPWVWPWSGLLINNTSCFSPVRKEEGSKVWESDRGHTKRGPQQRQKELTQAESVHVFSC